MSSGSNAEKREPATPKPRYPNHSTRLILRGIVTFLLFGAWIAYTVRGALCDDYLSKEKRLQIYLKTSQTKFCWTGRLAGNIRPFLITFLGLLWNIAAFAISIFNRRGLRPIVATIIDLIFALALLGSSVQLLYILGIYGVVIRRTYQGPSLLAGTVLATFAAIAWLVLVLLDIISAASKPKPPIVTTIPPQSIYYSAGPQGGPGFVPQQQQAMLVPAPPPGMTYGLMPVQQQQHQMAQPQQQGMPQQDQPQQQQQQQFPPQQAAHQYQGQRQMADSPEQQSSHPVQQRSHQNTTEEQPRSVTPP